MERRNLVKLLSVLVTLTNFKCSISNQKKGFFSKPQVRVFL